MSHANGVQKVPRTLFFEVQETLDELKDFRIGHKLASETILGGSAVMPACSVMGATNTSGLNKCL